MCNILEQMSYFGISISLLSVQMGLKDMSLEHMLVEYVLRPK